MTRKEEINLLPPAVQQQRRQFIYTARANGIYLRAIVVILFVWATLGAVYWFEWQSARSVDQQAASDQSDSAAVETRVQEVNAVVGRMVHVVREYPAVTPQLNDVFGVLPSEVQLRQLSYSSEDSDLEIRAVSASRPAALSFQRSLENISWVESVDAPLQNFATGDNTEFVFILHRR